MKLRLLLRRDLSGAGAFYAGVGAGFSVVLAGLGQGLGPAVMAAGLLSLLAALVGLALGTAAVLNDREGWIAAFVAGMGRTRYALMRLTATSLATSIAVGPSAILYWALRGSPAPAVAALLSAYAGAALGMNLGLSRERGYAYMWAVALWATLGLVYDVALAFAVLFIPVGPEAVAALLLANPLSSARLAGVAVADRDLLTLGEVGRVIPGWAFAASAVAWTAALMALFVAKCRTGDL